MYTGEQFDPELGDYYLRARYYNAQTGRFNRLDPFAGNNSDPQSLHKYTYCHGDPINGVDPSGEFAEIALAIMVILFIAFMYVFNFGPYYARNFANWGVEKGHPPKKIALITGPPFESMISEGIALIDITRLGDQLREAGHIVRVYVDPDEQEFIDALNQHNIVGINAHGPPDLTVGDSQNREPFAAFYLGGTQSLKTEILRTYPDGKYIGTPQRDWVTANEVQGKIINPKLEIAAAACNMARTNRFPKALGPHRMYIGSRIKETNTPYHVPKILRYVVNRANDLEMPVAAILATRNSSAIVMNPSNNFF